MKGKKGFQPGVSGNISGKPKGTPNKISKDIKEAFKMLIEKNIDNLSGWLDHVAKKDPEKAFNIIIDLSEFIIPKQKRTELTSKGGKDLFPKGGADLADEIYIKRNLNILPINKAK